MAPAISFSANTAVPVRMMDAAPDAGSNASAFIACNLSDPAISEVMPLALESGRSRSSCSAEARASGDGTVGCDGAGADPRAAGASATLAPTWLRAPKARQDIKSSSAIMLGERPSASVDRLMPAVTSVISDVTVDSGCSTGAAATVGGDIIGMGKRGRTNA